MDKNVDQGILRAQMRTLRSRETYRGIILTGLFSATCVLGSALYSSPVQANDHAPSSPPAHPLVQAEQRIETRAQKQAHTDLLETANQQTEHAYEILTEVRAIISAGKHEGVGEYTRNYNAVIREIVDEIHETHNGDTHGLIKALESVARATRRHTEILMELHDKAPEQAKSALEHSILVSQKGSNTALVRLDQLYSDAGDDSYQPHDLIQVFGASRGRGEQMRYGGTRGQSSSAIAARGAGVSAGRRPAGRGR